MFTVGLEVKGAWSLIPFLVNGRVTLQRILNEPRGTGS